MPGAARQRPVLIAFGPVGWPPIDAGHARIQSQLADLAHAGPAEHGARLAQLRATLAEAFGVEEALMTRHRFAPEACHRAEHDAVLRMMDDVIGLVEAGDHGVVRRLVVELPQWFALHAGLLDRALARFLAVDAGGDGRGADLAPLQ